MEIDAFTDKKCFKCQKTGHLAKQCPQKAGGGRDSKTKNMECYYCHKKGHMKKDCFKFKKDKEREKVKKDGRGGVKKASDDDDFEGLEEDWGDDEGIVGAIGMWEQCQCQGRGRKQDFRAPAAAPKLGASRRRRNRY